VKACRKTEWVVYAAALRGPEQVLTTRPHSHRVAISNDRLVCLEDGRVTFAGKITGLETSSL
jgi:hypothetical protein